MKEVQITYACTAPGGSRYVVEVGDQQIEAETKATGTWTSFETQDLGTIRLTADRHILSVKAKSLHGEGVMNLKSIVLRPVKQ